MLPHVKLSLIVSLSVGCVSAAPWAWKSTARAAAPSVTLDSATFIGASNATDGVDQFLGIPFAQRMRPYYPSEVCLADPYADYT